MHVGARRRTCRCMRACAQVLVRARVGVHARVRVLMDVNVGTRAHADRVGSPMVAVASRRFCFFPSLEASLPAHSGE